MSPAMCPAHAGPEPMIWELQVRRRLEHRGRVFTLDAGFASEARRVVVFGPSGAGKSQLLQAVAGLARPDAGRIAVAGRVLFDRDARIDLPARERRLGYLFQDYALFPHLTVAQNVAFGLQRGWRNPSGEPRDAAVERWLRAFELLPVLRQYPEQLSGGQRQRTALARALVGEPRALLLDEPFAALDTPLRARLRDELAELVDRLALPLLLISHDEADLRRFGDDAVVLDAGRVVPRAAAAAA